MNTSIGMVELQPKSKERRRKIVWINKLTDKQIKESVDKYGGEDAGYFIKHLYDEVKRLNLIINDGETPYTTIKTMSESEKKSVDSELFCNY